MPICTEPPLSPLGGQLTGEMDGLHRGADTGTLPHSTAYTGCLSHPDFVRVEELIQDERRNCWDRCSRTTKRIDSMNRYLQIFGFALDHPPLLTSFLVGVHAAVRLGQQFFTIDAVLRPGRQSNAGR